MRYLAAALGVFFLFAGVVYFEVSVMSDSCAAKGMSYRFIPGVCVDSQGVAHSPVTKPVELETP